MPPLSLINQCLTIYKDGLLIFDDYEWATADRDKLTKSYIELLEKGFQISIMNETEVAIDYLNRLLEFDPYNDYKIEQYLQLLIDAGMQKQAHSVFLTYEQKLNEDLALTPSTTLQEMSNKLFSHNQ